MKVDRQWVFIDRGEGTHENPYLVRIDGYKQARAVELARNMGVQVERRWTFDLDSETNGMLDRVMALLPGECVRCVLATALLMGLRVLLRNLERHSTVTEEKRRSDDGKTPSAN
jgi:hypothetical protein